MAVSILSIADTHTPAYNNQNLVASSTNSAQTNFKYVVTVEVNDGLYTQNIELKIPPRPDNSKLYFNPQKIVESQVKNSFTSQSTDFFFPNPSVPSSFKKVTIGIDEEYGSPVSGFGGASGSYYIWNGAYDSLDFADYTYSTTTSAKDLTLSPSLTDTIYYDQKHLLKTWHRAFGTRDLRYLYVESFDSGGNTVQVVTLENPFYNTSVFYSNNYVSCNISPYALNNWTGIVTAITFPLLPTIPTNTAYYTMYFLDSTPLISSNTYRVNIKTCNSRYKKYVLHFLNKLGNYDSFTFDLLSRPATDKETDMYKKIPYSLNASNEYRYEDFTNDTVIYNTVLTNKITLNSDWITDAEATWLRDLFMSPDVKLEILDTSALISVKCIPKNYETKLQNNDKCFNLIIDVENSLQDVRQRC